MHIYIRENAHWDIYAPPWQKHYTIFFFIFFFFFFHFRCILLQISHQKCFFISISIPGRSGVKKEIYKFPKTLTLGDGSKFFRISMTACQILKKQFLFYNQWCCRGGRRPPLNFESQCYFQYDTTKTVINFRGYSLIHINIMSNLDSMRH